MTRPAQHIELLRDRRRIESYARAIRSCVRPGDVVADLGAGVGPLSVLAAKAGAEKVYAVESEAEVAAWIERLAVANGVEGQLQVLVGDSREIEVPEPADWVLYDDVDILDLPGSSVSTLADARRRWLGEGGQLLPRELGIELAAVHLARPEASALVELSPPLSSMLKEMSAQRLSSDDCLRTEPCCILRAASDELGANGFDACARVTTLGGGHIDGLLMWLRMGLCPGEDLSLGPAAEVSAYPQIFLPLDGVSVSAGQELELSLRYRCPAGSGGRHHLWDWCLRAGEHEQRGSSFESMDLGL